MNYLMKSICKKFQVRHNSELRNNVLVNMLMDASLFTLVLGTVLCIVFLLIEHFVSVPVSRVCFIGCIVSFTSGFVLSFIAAILV